MSILQSTVEEEKRKKKKNYNQFILEEYEEVYYTLWKHKIDTDNT